MFGLVKVVGNSSTKSGSSKLVAFHIGDIKIGRGKKPEPDLQNIVLAGRWEKAEVMLCLQIKKGVGMHIVPCCWCLW